MRVAGSCPLVVGSMTGSIAYFMNIEQIVSEIDDLNRKIQGRPPRSFFESPFGGREMNHDLTSALRKKRKTGKSN